MRATRRRWKVSSPACYSPMPQAEVDLERGVGMERKRRRDGRRRYEARWGGWGAEAADWEEDA